MAAKTTAQAGDWGTGSTWTGGSAPIAGDTVTINHNVTVSDAQTIGNSPATSGRPNYVIDIATGKWITIVSGGALTVRGDTRLNGTGSAAAEGGVRVEGGGIWEFDASQAASPTTTNYYARSECYDKPGVFEAIGTSGNPAIVRSNETNSARAGWFYAGDYRWLRFTADYAQFTRIGEKRGSTVDLVIQSYESYYSITNSEFIDCGPISARCGLNNEVTIDNCTFTDTGTREVPSYTFDAMGVDYTIGTGVRLVSRCVFRRKAMASSGNSYGFRAFTIDRCVFEKRESWIWTPAAVTNCFFRCRDSNDTHQLGTTTQDNYFFVDPATPASNPHTLAAVSNSVNQGNIFECGVGTTDTTGDACFSPSSGTAAFIGNLFLPWKGTTEPSFGASVNCMINSGAATITVEHNTWFTKGTSGENGSLRYGETLTVPANAITAFRSNLAYSPVADQGYLAHKFSSSDSATNAITAANCNYNGVFNPSPGVAGDASDGGGYHNFRVPTGNPMFSAPVDVNGVIADPQFVDMTRNIATWAVARGYSVASDYATRSSDAWTALVADPSRVTDLVSWVKAGWAPTNTAFQDADYETATAGVSPTGGWIGAVEGVATITAGRSRIVNAGATGGSTRGVLINSGGV